MLGASCWTAALHWAQVLAVLVFESGSGYLMRKFCEPGVNPFTFGFSVSFSVCAQMGWGGRGGGGGRLRKRSDISFISEMMSIPHSQCVCVCFLNTHLQSPPPSETGLSRRKGATCFLSVVCSVPSGLV